MIALEHAPADDRTPSRRVVTRWVEAITEAEVARTRLDPGFVPHSRDELQSTAEIAASMGRGLSELLVELFRLDSHRISRSRIPA